MDDQVSTPEYEDCHPILMVETRHIPFIHLISSVFPERLKRELKGRARIPDLEFLKYSRVQHSNSPNINFTYQGLSI
jgi:hypothetical protein